MLARSPAYLARRSHSQPCFPAPSADIIGHPIAARNPRTPRRRAAPRFRGRPWRYALAAVCDPPCPYPSATSSSCNRPRSSAPSRPPAAPRSRSCLQPRAFEAACCLAIRQTLAAPGGPPAPYPEAVAPSSLLGRIAALSPSPRRTPPILPSQRFGQTASFCEICIDLNPAPKQIYAYRSKMRS